MASETEICNMALSHLGVSKEIANLETERSAEASACRRFYDMTRDEVLRGFPWPFATKFAALGLVSDSDDDDHGNDEWDYAYRYPTDCLKMRRIKSGTRNDSRSSRVPYIIAKDDEGKLIYTDQEDAEAEYTVLVDDPGLYPPDFVMALSLRLAAYIAPRLTAGDPFKMGDRSLKLYVLSQATAEANAVNEQQDEDTPDPDLIRARE